MNTIEFKIGDTVVCENAKPLSKTGYGPDLIAGKQYEVKRIYTEYSEGMGGPEYQHLDVGLITDFEIIRSLDTGTPLPLKDNIGWCHPSRFKLAAI